MWVTDENNRRIIGMLGRIIGKIFQELQNKIIGKIKSILGSGLTWSRLVIHTYQPLYHRYLDLTPDFPGFLDIYLD